MAPANVQCKQRAAVAAAAAKIPATDGGKNAKPPWGQRAQHDHGKHSPEADKWKQECQKLRAQLAKQTTAPTPESADDAGNGDGADADGDEFAAEIAELQKLVDSMASAKSEAAIEHRTGLQERLSHLRDKQRAQWPLDRRILLADRRKADREQALQKAEKRLADAMAAQEAAQKAAVEAQTKADEARAALDKATSEREQLGEVKPKEPAEEADPSPAKAAAKEAAWTQADKCFQEELGEDEEAKAAWTLVQSKLAQRREQAKQKEAAAATASDDRAASMDVEAESAEVLRSKLAQRGIQLTSEQARQLEEADTKRQRKT